MPRTPPPLRPGPPGEPVLGHARAFAADRLGFVERLSHDHGDVATFRVGPYRVWQLSHPDLVHEALVTRAKGLRKGPVLRRASAFLGDGLLTSEGERHRRHRRAVQAAFRPDAVAAHAPAMARRAAERADRWAPGRPVDAHDEARRMALLVAGDALLGTDLDDEADAVAAAMADAMAAYRLALAPFGWRLQRLPVGPMRRLRRARATLDRLVEGVIARRRAEPGDDLLSGVLAEGRLSDDEVRDEAITLLMAGHETTASALAFAARLLAVDRDLQERLGAEVDDALGSRPPSAEDLAALPTVLGLFLEAVRLYPPSWAMGREVTEDREAGGHRIVAGDLLLLPQWVVHRDRRWWPDPLRCDPDRWLPDAASARPRGAFFAFGGGARQCIGQGFAEVEGVIALATVLQRWRLRPAPGPAPELDPLMTLRPRGGVWVVPEPRG